jgi:serine/threonine protein kinase
MGATTVPPTLCIVMEYCKEGTLYDLLHRRKTVLADKDKKLLTQQILAALQFLHKNGIVHRDIKSHNFLVNNYYQVKLCDFGLARHKVQHLLYSLN